MANTYSERCKLEFEKAKEHLSIEGKRIFNELSRDWSSTLSLFIKDYTQNVQSEIDLIIKNYLSKNLHIQQIKTF